MKLSNLTVNLAMRSRSSSKPKLMFGRESAIDGASADARGGRIVLVESEGSKAVDILREFSEFCFFNRESGLVWLWWSVWSCLRRTVDLLLP